MVKKKETKKSKKLKTIELTKQVRSDLAAGIFSDLECLLRGLQGEVMYRIHNSDTTDKDYENKMEEIKKRFLCLDVVVGLDD